MSENVIEQIIQDIRNDASDIEANHPNHRGRHVAEMFRDLADYIQTKTDPRQFMPPLSEWAEDARWCSVSGTGIFAFWKNEPVISSVEMAWTGVLAWPGCIEITIPLGIDWRTLKVSRQQMEEWEENNET